MTTAFCRMRKLYAQTRRDVARAFEFPFEMHRVRRMTDIRDSPFTA